MMRSVREKCPEAKIDGVSLEEMVKEMGDDACFDIRVKTQRGKGTQRWD